MFAIPIGVDLRALARPFVTWVVIGLCGAVFLWQQGLSPADAQSADLSFGMVPAVLLRHATLPPDLAVIPSWASPMTALFLHGGWLHILGNMLFLWIFGKGVEDAVGHGRFVVFYLACGAVSCFAQAFSDPTSNIAVIGASGAVAGVLAGFLWLFPRTKVRVLIVILLYVRVIEVPALLVLGLWFASQVLGAAAAPAATGGIAFWAHLGGFTSGLALLPLLTRRPLQLFAAGSPLWGAGSPPSATPERKERRGRVPPSIALTPFGKNPAAGLEPHPSPGVSLVGQRNEGDRRMSGASHSTASIAQALSGIDFPAERDDLVKHAKKNNADKDVIEALRILPEEQYSSMADVFKGVGQSH